MAKFFQVRSCTWKIGHVSQTMPHSEVIYHPYGKTWYNLPVYKISQLQLRYGWGPQNLKEALLLQKDCATCLSVEIMQLQNIPIKQIGIDKWPWSIYTQGHCNCCFYIGCISLLLVACCYNVSIQHRFEILQLLKWTWLPVTLRTPSLLRIKLKLRTTCAF